MLYIQHSITNQVPQLVRAQPTPAGHEYRVWDPEGGYSIWPADQFEGTHRILTRRELQLVNHSMAELEVMSISDADQWDREILPADEPYVYNLITGKINTPDGRQL